MANITDLAGYITSLHQRYARQLASDIARLKTEHGSTRVEQALALAKQAEPRTALSISVARRQAPGCACR